VPPFLVLLVNLALAFCLVLAATRGRLMGVGSRRSAALAALPLVDAGLLAAFVFGEDSYRGNGVSRWDAYRSPGGALGLLFILSISLSVVWAALILLAGLRGRRRLLRLATIGAGLTGLLLLTSTIIGFSTN
jgi:hypothetical protein